ncbi:hypothetical protein [Alcanivorax sp.]|jgi:hypothetical protein|uniref:hypothetical protein n=1 Tax=Alcanivorax sp. TaxID=1872427 RepID=UPI0032D93601
MSAAISVEKRYKTGLLVVSDWPSASLGFMIATGQAPGRRGFPVWPLMKSL